MQFRKLKSLKFLYEINENGVLRNVKSKKIVKGYVEKNGYVRVKIENKCLNGIIRTSIHQLVAEAFIPNPLNKPQINHKDGNKMNNNVNNLEWCTASENMIHATLTGLNSIEPLKEYTTKQRKKILCIETNQIYESISKASEWAYENNYCKNIRSGIAQLTQVLHKRKETFAKKHWKFI